ncbi:hypothetical protein NPIL_169601 [Nephila pilipes]|uniref:Uncharacterized protein n=1 Tax=Nephila pilipes TaxID=299642 RepID=A0A8X6IM23_NEPPI|nr:hypothetical protein NPIL_169601 [Nephila pilipes]
MAVDTVTIWKCSEISSIRQARTDTWPLAVEEPKVSSSPLLAIQESPRPYEFGYKLGDGLDMTQHRREVSDGTEAV